MVIGEGIKDNAPGLFVGDRLGTWESGAPHFDIALDPIDGTTNLANGLPNSISVMAAFTLGSTLTGSGFAGGFSSVSLLRACSVWRTQLI